MRLADLRDKLVKKGKPTPLGWIVMASFVIVYMGLKHMAQGRRDARAAASERSPFDVTASTKVLSDKVTLPETPLPAGTMPQAPAAQTPPAALRQFNQPSFGNINASGKILSDDFLPKGTLLYATLTSDIVSNNQVSPATATLIHPAIFAHGIRVPVGTQITGRIAPATSGAVSL